MSNYIFLLLFIICEITTANSETVGTVDFGRVNSNPNIEIVTYSQRFNYKNKKNTNIQVLNTYSAYSIDSSTIYKYNTFFLLIYANNQKQYINIKA